MLQVMTLGLAGSLLGVAAGARRGRGCDPAGRSAASTSLLASVHYGADLERGRCRASAIGVLVSLLFSLVPLLRGASRQAVAAAARRDARGRGATRLGRAWRPCSVSAGAGRAHGLAGGVAARRRSSSAPGFAALRRAAPGRPRCWSRAIAPLRAARGRSPLRHAVLHLSRPGNQTRVDPARRRPRALLHRRRPRRCRRTCSRSSRSDVGADAPDMFLLDIQRGPGRRRARVPGDPAHGAGGVAAAFRCCARGSPASAGEDVTLESFEDVRGAAARSAASTPSPIATDLEAQRARRRGRVLAGGRRPDAEVSIEQSMRERFSDCTSATRCGSTSSAGPSTPRVTASATSSGATRAPAASCSCSGPGVLEQAPQTYIAPAQGPGRTRRRGRGSSTTWSRAFPNVSVIDFREILETVRDVMSQGHARHHRRRRPGARSAAC